MPFVGDSRETVSIEGVTEEVEDTMEESDCIRKTTPTSENNLQTNSASSRKNVVSYGGNAEDWSAVRKIGWLIGARGLMELFNAVLTEQKTLIISKDKSFLGQACYAASLLLSPMKWCGIYIPLLPEQLHNVIESPTPFIAGMTSINGLDVPDVSLLIFSLSHASTPLLICIL